MLVGRRSTWVKEIIDKQNELFTLLANGLSEAELNAFSKVSNHLKSRAKTI